MSSPIMTFSPSFRVSTRCDMRPPWSCGLQISTGRVPRAGRTRPLGVRGELERGRVPAVPHGAEELDRVWVELRVALALRLGQHARELAGREAPGGDLAVDRDEQARIALVLLRGRGLLPPLRLGFAVAPADQEPARVLDHPGVPFAHLADIREVDVDVDSQVSQLCAQATDERILDVCGMAHALPPLSGGLPSNALVMIPSRGSSRDVPAEPAEPARERVCALVALEPASGLSVV